MRLRAFWRGQVKKRYVNDDRLRVDGDKNMRLLAFALTIVLVGTGPEMGEHFLSFGPNKLWCRFVNWEKGFRKRTGIKRVDKDQR